MREEAGSRAATSAAWRALCGELDRWHKGGRVATFWWRDDDATTPTAQLDRLLALADGVPLALAVVPAKAEPGLAAALSGAARVAVLQHGWRHANHGTAKKSEYPAARDPAAVGAELRAGRDRLGGLFGERALPVLAPPWNRFADRFRSLLPDAGLRGLSRQGARPATAAGGEVNVHADLVDWHGGRGFVGVEAALSAIATHLAARREGRADSAEPTGILTHHLIQDRDAEAFLNELLAVMGDHPAARWLDARDMFGTA